MNLQQYPQSFPLPSVQNIPTQSSQLPIPTVQYISEFPTSVLPANLPFTTSVNLYSDFPPQSLALPSVQNIPATDLPSKASAKLYPYFPNGYFEQNFTQEELIKGK